MHRLGSTGMTLEIELLVVADAALATRNVEA